MKIKQAINLHKFLTFLVVLSLMAFYNNFTIAPWVYLALHGTYGLMWLIKDSLYPDQQWEKEISLPVASGDNTMAAIRISFCRRFLRRGRFSLGNYLILNTVSKS